MSENYNVMSSLNMFIKTARLFAFPLQMRRERPPSIIGGTIIGRVWLKIFLICP